MIKTQQSEEKPFITAEQTGAVPTSQVVEEKISSTQTSIPVTYNETGKIPILMFHYVRTVDREKDPVGYNLSIEPESFEKILQYLKENHYQTIHLSNIFDQNIEILSHTVNHSDLSKDKNAKKEIDESKEYLEDLIGKPITGFVYPAGKFNTETAEIIEKAGYKAALTTKENFSDIKKDLFHLSRLRIDNRNGLKGLIKKLGSY